MRKTARDVLAEVANKHRITVADLIGPCRRYPFSRPRQEAYYRVYVECPHLSLPAVGRSIGGRDHTTVLHGIKAHCERAGIDYTTVRRVGPRTVVPPPGRSTVTPPSVDAYRGASRYAV